ncbi:MAG: DUF4143 domain-containing protein, partial [Candidatus Tectomicrobia bacterium]
RDQFIQTYLERDLGVMGFNAPPLAMRRFWTMLAHVQGQQLNVSQLAEAMGETQHKTRRYLETLASTFMIRLLQPWHANVKKREVKASKVYIADSGLLHALLGLEAQEDLMGHPKRGASWEGFAMGEIIARLGLRAADCYFWALHGGAELDLLTHQHGRLIGYEFKLSSAPRTTKSMHSAVETLGLDMLYVIHPGEQHWPMAANIQALGLAATEPPSLSCAFTQPLHFPDTH